MKSWWLFWTGKIEGIVCFKGSKKFWSGNTWSWNIDISCSYDFVTMCRLGLKGLVAEIEERKGNWVKDIRTRVLNGSSIRMLK